MRVDINEKELLQGLARNDRKAIEIIYRENYNMIQSLVLSNSGSAEDAKDVFQEAMIVLYEKVRSGRFELNCLIKTYVYSVGRRLWLKRLQQMSHYAPILENLLDVVPVEEEIEEIEKINDEFQAMDKAIGSLGEPCKSLLEAYYLQKKNMQDIAVSFGYTNADNAKNQKYKCLMRLKKIFFAHYKNGNGNG
ncbi:MAG TPA: sigma-70 family RNA polymerase sigma factor [Chitinophagaceae bacterium]